MRILTNLFPEGKKTALTMSYDDGCDSDKRLVEIFNKNGIKGTFHLNSVHMSKPGNGRVQFDEVKDLYKGHEVSCHTFTHPHPTCVPDTMLVNEILEDRRALEKACGYTVRGGICSVCFGKAGRRACRDCGAGRKKRPDWLIDGAR